MSSISKEILYSLSILCVCVGCEESGYCRAEGEGSERQDLRVEYTGELYINNNNKINKF